MQVKLQSADAQFSLNRKGEDKKSLDDQFPGLTASQKVLACAPQTEMTVFKIFEEAEGPIIHFVPELCMMAGTMCNEKVKIQTLAEFISAYSTDADSHSALASVGRPNARFIVRSDGWLVRVCPFDGASQKVVSPALRPGFLRLYHHSFLSGHSGKRRMYDYMRKELHWPHMANDVYKTVHDYRSYAQNRTYG